MHKDKVFFTGMFLLAIFFVALDIETMKMPTPKIQRKPGIMGKIKLQEDIRNTLFTSK